MIAEWGLFFFAAYCAAAAATIAGFGSSTLLIPVAVQFMDIKSAVFLAGCFHLFSNLFKVKLFFKSIDYKIFFVFGIPSVLFTFLGAYLIETAPVEILIKILGVFLIIFSIVSWWKPHLKLGNSQLTCALGGCCSGFFTGLIGLGGALRSSVLISFQLEKNIYVATSALIALCNDITRIPTYLWRGIVENTDYYKMIPLLFVIAYLGVRTGKLLIDKINQDMFRKLLLGALLLAGLKILFS